MANYGDIESLKDYWKKLLFNNKLAHRLGENARQHILKNFSAIRMAKEYTNLYQQL